MSYPLYVYCEQEMKEVAERMQPQGTVISVQDFLMCPANLYRNITELHFIGHGNWDVFRLQLGCELAPNPLAARIAPFLQARQRITRLTINACHSTNRIHPNRNRVDAYCKQLAIQLKMNLPQFPYLEIVGFTGEVFLDYQGRNRVWKEPPPTAAEKLQLKLFHKEKLLQYYDQRTKPAEDEMVIWRIFPHYHSPCSDPETPTSPISPSLLTTSPFNNFSRPSSPIQYNTSGGANTDISMNTTAQLLTEEI